MDGGKKIAKQNYFVSESPILNVRFDPEDNMVAAGTFNCDDHLLTTIFE